ncbi:uncharacterized protein LOC119305879 [Triticum dicoccoides]|uniref:uncharacterized protein LOC119305879 n=1 Tax=Triticum dicoccoides TaxID=85692 RepID=UPI00188E5080|nr:uncharacterized protein LOC119305879 [Triticum dicoccoides]
MTARQKKSDNIVVSPKVGIITRGRMSNVNDMASLETNHTTVPRGHCVTPTFEITVQSDEGLNLSVDLNSTPSEYTKIYSQQLGDVSREAQLEAPTENAEVEDMAVEDNIGCGDMLPPVSRGAEFKAQVENEEREEVLMEEEIGCADKLIVTEGTQLTLSRDKHESPVKTELVAQEVVMEEDIGCDDNLPGSNQVLISHANQDAGFTNHSLDEVLNHTSSTLPSIGSAPRVDVEMKDGALERQIMGAPKSGGVAENSNDQIRDSVVEIKKIRDSILRKEFTLQDGSAQCDMDIHKIKMDIQKIKTEKKMTKEVLSTMKKYKEPSSNIMKVANLTFSGDDGKTKSTKRMELKFKEALAQRDKCMELNDICCDCDWMAPRYTVLPSLADGMHVGEVRLKCPDFEMSITSDPCPTPHDARCSAAANMILELGKKVEDKEHHAN